MVESKFTYLDLLGDKPCHQTAAVVAEDVLDLLNELGRPNDD